MESLPSPHVTNLAKYFDAVLLVLVARGEDAEAPLAEAVAALTAFATGDFINMPVDEA